MKEMTTSLCLQKKRHKGIQFLLVLLALCHIIIRGGGSCVYDNRGSGRCMLSSPMGDANKTAVAEAMPLHSR